MRSPGCQRDEQRTGRSGEWGFTLPELLATIVIIGVIAAIAIPSFFALIEARRVESAANQLASDLRLAHSRATNQVGTEWVVTLYPDTASQDDGPDYTLAGSNTRDFTLPGNIEISDPSSETTLTFKSNGTVESDGPPGDPITVEIADDKLLGISRATSNVEVRDV